MVSSGACRHPELLSRSAPRRSGPLLTACLSVYSSVKLLPSGGSRERSNPNARELSLRGRALTVLAVNSGGLSFTSVTVMMAVAVLDRP